MQRAYRTTDLTAFSVLDDEERQSLLWIKAFLADPESKGGFATLQDCGFDIIQDLLDYLSRYQAAYNQLRADLFLEAS